MHVFSSNKQGCSTKKYRGKVPSMKYNFIWFFSRFFLQKYP